MFLQFFVPEAQSGPACMKTHFTLLTVVAALLLAGNLVAQEKKSEAAATEKATPTAADLEAKFKTLLTNAALSGRWSPVENGQLGQEKKEDKYEIVSATKVKDDQWLISARMKYGKNEMVVPIPVQVKWSGETPVIIVNNLSMGGGRSYSARVLFYDGTYSGSWNSSAGYGGVLYGTVDHAAPAKTDSKEKPAENK